MRTLVLTTFLALGLAGVLAAQDKLPVPASEYGQFGVLAPFAPNGGLSPDGQWLAYLVNRADRTAELHLASVAGGADKSVPFGAQPAYSSDSRWLAFAVGYSEAQEAKFRKEKKRSEKKLGLINIATGAQTLVDGIESFAFSPNGAYLAMLRYPPEKRDPAPVPGATPSPIPADDTTPGATLIVKLLASGRDTAFGNVGEFAWQNLERTGRLLALTINVEDKTGNAVQLFDPETAALRVLDSSASVYSGLAWRKNSADLAVLRSWSNDQKEGAGQVAMAWESLGTAAETAHVYDPAKDSRFPAGMRLVAYRRPSWADDGGTVSLGFAPWAKKIPVAKPKVPGSPEADKEAPEQPSVDVWHWRDFEVLPKQKLSAKQNREKNLLAAWKWNRERWRR